MPVDLTRGGQPSAYPAHGPRFLPWLGIWALCFASGACAALLLWPAHTPTQGAWFWLCVVGAPNALFALLFGVARTGYETAYLHALYRNQHRQNWLRERIAGAQRPLYVLGYAYHLPLGDNALAPTIIAGESIMTAQKPRNGAGHILHTRLPDIEPTVMHEPDVDQGETASEDGAAKTTDLSEVARVKPDGFGLVIQQLLSPLAATVHVLSQSGPQSMPVVRLVTARPDNASSRVQLVREALSHHRLPPLACNAASADDGLMLADTWLDAREQRPLLVIAAEWYDAPPPTGSTEGGVAILLCADASAAQAVGTLHRPVATALNTLEEDLPMAALWGKAMAEEVRHAWISGIGAEHDGDLTHAFGEASLTGIASTDAQHFPDRILGHAGAAAGWLAIVAAVESGTAGPQLIINQTQTVQAAVLYAHPKTTHEDRAEAE
ncbi:hypothetical protein PQR71_38090 [Paraburkholderia fungorum]|uniref:hypothetical protein n=1 Tax=Paraburkholderia fungorum TaxID=134537 RepID=UPI0038B99276